MKQISIALTIILVLCSASYAAAQHVTKYYTYTVAARYPHATDKYTQGLEIVDGVMYESTGLYGGESRLMKVDIPSGVSKTIATLPDNQFGEGITIMGDTIYMLTWQEYTLHMFHRETGAKIDQRRYTGEGWGITNDGERLYMSDGSSSITVRDRETFNILSRHTIMLNKRPITGLNELEWIDGKIWANVYTSDYIVIIDPATWRIDGVVDLTGILPQSQRTDETDVLNGVAYDNDTKKIYVTGKLWNTLFEIKLIEKQF